MRQVKFILIYCFYLVFMGTPAIKDKTERAENLTSGNKKREPKFSFSNLFLLLKFNWNFGNPNLISLL